MDHFYQRGDSKHMPVIYPLPRVTTDLCALIMAEIDANGPLEKAKIRERLGVRGHEREFDESLQKLRKSGSIEYSTKGWRAL